MIQRLKSTAPDPDLVDVNLERPKMIQESSVWRQKAVCVRHAFKDYGSKKNSNHVLSNLNMFVEKGTIYGLLGASGCGKTTLLYSIVGRKKLDSGEIWVLGGKPGTKGSGVPGKRVGYMPQEIALYGEFSIKETMLYFGWIYGMDTEKIIETLKFLLKFLDLPSQNRFVKNLSGGQQRRVSFCIALLHDPELLILDEPTVGVDPLLRQSIWNHLVEITKEGNKTVILTTHYIEEAKQAHTIGLMRNGKLLAEQAPHVLLSMYSCSSLEEVFLKLSRKQQVEDRATQADNIISNNNAIEMSSSGNIFKFEGEAAAAMIQEVFKDCDNIDASWTTKGKFRALLTKNFLRMWRNISVMLFIFALPVMQVILFCLAIGGDPKSLKIAIVNNEVGFINRTYVDCPVQWIELGNLSCLYLQAVNKSTVSKVYYPDVESAKQTVRKGKAWGVMFFHKNFTNALRGRLTDGINANDETLDQSEIKVWLDMSNQQIGLILQRDLQLSFKNFMTGLLRIFGENQELAELPITFKEPIYGSSQPSYTDFVAPGVILTIVFFLAVALTSSALIIEKIEGLLDRSWVAGVTSSEILFSHVITQFVVMCGQTALVLIFMMVVFGVQCKGDIATVVCLTFLQGLCGMCFGFFISAICEVERNAMQLALGSFYPTLLLSGVMWPVEGMPNVLRFISTFLPLTLATTSLRAMMTRGWSLVESDVYYGFLSTIIWIVLFLTISLVMLRVKQG